MSTPLIRRFTTPMILKQQSKQGPSKTVKIKRFHKKKHAILAFTASGSMSLLDGSSLAANKQCVQYSVTPLRDDLTGNTAMMVIEIGGYGDLMAYVNNEEVLVGARQFHLCKGDRVEWIQSDPDDFLNGSDASAS